MHPRPDDTNALQMEYAIACFDGFLEVQCLDPGNEISRKQMQDHLYLGQKA